MKSTGGKYLILDYSHDSIIETSFGRITLAPHFPGLRHFKQGRNFKQWTGDDSKALMKVNLIILSLIFILIHFCIKVYISAIEGHVPTDMVRAFNAYLDFCYLVRRNVLDEEGLDQIDDALRRFHQYRKIFQETGVRDSTPEGFALPRQHVMIHYRLHIENFGAPNGLCSSITESKHIVAVKRPWRRSSRYKALKQMLTTNERLDKLAAARIDFQTRGMLKGSCLADALHKLTADEEDEHEHNEDEDNNEDEDEDEEEDTGDEDKDEDNNNEGDNGSNNGDDYTTNDSECGAIDSPTTLYNEVVLSRMKGFDSPI
jgi:hypothetical protein